VVISVTDIAVTQEEPAQFQSPNPAIHDLPNQDKVRTSRDDFRDFIGPNAERYLRAYDLRQARRRAFGSFSLAAAFIPLAWLMYRKMYVAAGILLLGSLIIGLVMPDIGPGAGIAAVFGVLGKTLYLSHAESRIRKIGARHLPPAEHVALLKRAGGVSWISGAIGAIIMAGCVLAVIAAHGQNG
jgi:hypothetical protein